MNIKISDTARAATTKCRKGFVCLKNGKKDLCVVEDCVNDQVLFVKCLSGQYCSYQQPFGNEFICSCPIRKELFDKYKI